MNKQILSIAFGILLLTTIYAHLCPDQAIKELRDKFGKRNAHQGLDAVGGKN